MERKTIQLPQPRDLGPREWGTETLIVEGPYFIGKRLEMHPGTAGGLQYHAEKEEAFLLVEGDAFVDSDDGRGRLVTQTITPGMMVYVPAGATHRVRAITRCVFYEWSTPHFNDRVRVEHLYGEEQSGGLPSTRHSSTDSAGKCRGCGSPNGHETNIADGYLLCDACDLR